ncbi:TetR/AcrR family transcriptional regulator [Neorhizobium galegae]|uniref:TetR/AcrR family transcriptional regulator n=1 Tax=Neorhizobium galegae TaxID=399 RepID=UPI000621792D|nr:TetR/AcrR family transcriptional regulator [Neorhizobium galegae]MCQ1765497.1 TetR/AcrR family transcriptional regulator [Neorhizobium galegae]MCQ1844411.1 TetR/AcrR family transcriptional regulator [Neorhizobium galegae]CDZ33077.1 Transcriptional regulator, TetR family [Neorhizobium galegae bv. officinalis]
MRVSRQEAEENRVRVVLKAGELFREYGFDGIGIADLMKAAGLTHGGFYGQFKSKVDLAAEASRQALALNVALWRETISRAGGKAIKAIAGMYLSRPNLVVRAKGCTFASLCADASRQGEAVQSVFAEGIENHLLLLQEIVDGHGDEDRRRKSIVIFSQMVGGLTLARAVGDAPLAAEILATLRNELETRH